MRFFLGAIGISVIFASVIFFAMMVMYAVLMTGGAGYATYTIMTMPSVVVNNMDACEVGFRTTFMSEMATSAVNVHAAFDSMNLRINESGTDVRLIRQLSALLRTQRRMLPCQLEPVYIAWEIMTKGVSV